MFESVSSLAVYVSDMERAKRFYTEILGFEVAHDLGPVLCFLRSASGRIDIYMEAGHEPVRVNPGTCRVGFYLQTERSAPELFAQLKAAGVNLLEDAPEQVADDTYCFGFSDPDGNIIEVSARP